MSSYTDRPPGPANLLLVAILLGISGPALAAVGLPLKADAGAPRLESRRVDLQGLPLAFEANAGQAPADVRFLAHGADYAIGLQDREAVLEVEDPGAASLHREIRLRLPDAGRTGSPQAEQPLPGRVNYYIGNDPANWHRNVRTYGRIRYRQVHPGVDLTYYGTQGRLEYDFVVAPGASTEPIALAFEGADQVSAGAGGRLDIRAGARVMHFEAPRAYQRIDGVRTAIPASYRIDGHTIRFDLGRYDHAHALVIDPVLSYFSYLGGSGADVIGATPPSVSGVSSQAAALDNAGNLYVTGYTQSPNFPTQSPFAAPTAKTSGTTWAFVTKFAADAKSIVYSSYVGGSNGDDRGFGIALDASGNAFAVGSSGSSDFPTTSGAYLRICSPTYTNSPNNPFSGCGNNNGNESFVTKFSPTGSLLASTFIGGTHTLSQAMAVTVDANGRPYVVGSALPGEDVPTGIGGYNQAVGFQTTTGALVRAYPYIANVPVNGALQYDAYLSVFNPTLTTLVYSTLIGDDRPQNSNPSTFTSQADADGTAVALDPSGNIYVAGWTGDAYLPVTSGALQSTVSSCGGTIPPNQTSLEGQCTFVAKFTPAGGSSAPSLTYLTYLGGAPSTQGSIVEHATGIAADAAGDAFVVGYSDTAAFPMSSGAYQNTCNGYGPGNPNSINCTSEFIAKLNPSGSTLLASTYFGCVTCSGDAVYTAGAVVLDGMNNVYINGIAGNSLPLVNGFATNNGAGGVSPFVAELDSTLSTLKFATLLNVGGGGQISSGGLAVDAAGSVYLAGSVNSPAGSAATSGAAQGSYGGGSSDGFVAKIVVTAATTTTLTVTPATTTTGTTVTFSATVAEASGASVPTGSVTFSNGATTLGTGTLNSSGVASFATSTLAAGSYTVGASYGGDTGNNASNSATVALTITTPQPVVTISVSPTTITQGASATLTWSSTDATACTASGSWTGSQATSGSATVTPSSAGSPSYALDCTGAGGTGSATATLTVNAPASGGGGGGGGSSGGGGGGAFGDWTMLLLSLAALARRLAWTRTTPTAQSSAATER